MLMPRKVKHRKQQRGRLTGQAKGGTAITFGDYGIQALEPGWISARQIEAARIAMTRHVKRGGKVWIRVFPDKPVTKKPAETRMGSGKGNPEYWVAVVKPGRVMFEIAGVSLGRPADNRERRDRAAAHGVDVAQRIDRGDGAEGVRVVHDRGEEIHRLDEGELRRQLVHAGVVGGVKPDQHILIGPTGHGGEHPVQQLWTQFGRSTRRLDVCG